MNDNDEIVCKNSWGSKKEIVKLPLYGPIKQAFYLHIKQEDYKGRVRGVKRKSYKGGEPPSKKNKKEH